VIALIFAAAVASAPPLRPDPLLTPGANNPTVVDASVTQANIATTICRDGGYTNQKGVRNVSEATKKAVFAEYGVDPKGVGAPFEIDHDCSLELGCTNSQMNLWPQSYSTTPWNAHIKDRYEDFLHAEVCHGRMTLQAAQHEISTDWIAGYQSHPELPKVAP